MLPDQILVKYDLCNEIPMEIIVDGYDGDGGYDSIEASFIQEHDKYNPGTHRWRIYHERIPMSADVLGYLMSHDKEIWKKIEKEGDEWLKDRKDSNEVDRKLEEIERMNNDYYDKL